MIGSEQLAAHLAVLPDDMTGLRVLDAGCADGWIANWAAGRGADVVAIDVERYPQIDDLHPNVSWRQMSVYDLDRSFDTFDIVLCLGLLYHLRHPLLGLERLRDVCRDQLIVESQICDAWFLDECGRQVGLDGHVRRVPMAQFYPDDRLNADPTNWWSPTMAGLKAMVESCGFKIDDCESNGRRGWVFARCA